MNINQCKISSSFKKVVVIECTYVLFKKIVLFNKMEFLNRNFWQNSKKYKYLRFYFSLGTILGSN